MRYKAASGEVTVFGLGRTSKMSSTELTFSADQFLEVGMKAEISIAWPVLLDNRVRLQLVVEGAVVRNDGDLCAVEIWKYHYRTRGPWTQTESADRVPLELPLASVNHLPAEPAPALHMHA